MIEKTAKIQEAERFRMSVYTPWRDPDEYRWEAPMAYLRT